MRTTERVRRQHVIWGICIRNLRIEYGMNQSQYAIATGISQSTVSRIEAGKPMIKFDDTERLVKPFPFPVTDLYELMLALFRKYLDTKWISPRFENEIAEDIKIFVATRQNGIT